MLWQLVCVDFVAGDGGVTLPQWSRTGTPPTSARPTPCNLSWPRFNRAYKALSWRTQSAYDPSSVLDLVAHASARIHTAEQRRCTPVSAASPPTPKQRAHRPVALVGRLTGLHWRQGQWWCSQLLIGERLGGPRHVTTGAAEATPEQPSQGSAEQHDLDYDDSKQRPGEVVVGLWNRCVAWVTGVAWAA